jgi:hypothetical protein
LVQCLNQFSLKNLASNWHKHYTYRLTKKLLQISAGASLFLFI